MADYVLSAVLRLRDEMTGKLKSAGKAVAGLSRAATGIGKATEGIAQSAASLKNFGVNLGAGELARLERLKGVMEAAGMTVSKPKPVDIRANDSASSKIKKIQQELNNLVGKKWEVAVNVKNNATAALKNMKTGVGEMFGGAAMGMGATMLGTAGIGYGAVNAIQSQMEFEKQMSSVKAIYSGTYEGKDLDSVMERLTAAAEHAGATTKFTAKEAGESLYYMGMAGWSAEQAESGLMPVLNLASAGDTELGLTSDILTDSMTGFQLKAGTYIKNAQGKMVEASKQYADMMAALVTNANTDIPMLGETLKYASSNIGAMYADQTAEDRLLGAQDTMLIAGLMANAGIKSSQAGTSIRSFFAREGSENRNAYAAAQASLGVDFSDENGKVRRIKDIFGDLRKRFNEGMDVESLLDFEEYLSNTKIHKDTRRKLESMLKSMQEHGGAMSGADKLKMAAMINGQEGMSGLLAVLTASEDDWNKINKALDEAEGATDRMAKIKMDNLAGDITYLGSAWDAFQRSFVKGDASAGLREFVQSITQTLTKANELFKDGIDIGDLGTIAVDVIAKLKAKFLELDGIGSILAGGTLVFGLKKILSLGLKVKDTLSDWSKVRTAGDVGNILRGGKGLGAAGSLQSASTMNVSTGTMNVRAGAVNLSGAIKGGTGGAGGTGRGIGIGGAGGTGGAGVSIVNSRAGGAAAVLTATQIAEQKAIRSAAAARQAQAKADSMLAAAWANPNNSAKIMAQYERASQQAAKAQARANQEAARFAQLRANDERAASYYSKREAVTLQQRYASDVAAAQNEAVAAKYARRREIAGGAAGGAAMGAVFGLADFAATRTTGTYNLNQAKAQLDIERNELKNLRDQGADISQINTQIETIRKAEENVKQVSEANAANERRAGAGAAGMIAGTAIGAALGSAVPIIGNMVGGMLGGFIGQKIGEYAADTTTPVEHTKKRISAAAESEKVLEKYSGSIVRHQQDKNTSSEEIQARILADQQRQVTETLTNYSAGINRHQRDNRVSAMSDTERVRIRREDLATRVADEEKQIHKAAEQRLDNAKYAAKINDEEFTRAETFGGTSLGNLNVAEGWTDVRGGGIKTVDETSAKIQTQREAFESGIAKNQSALSQISANTTEGQRRAQTITDSLNSIFNAGAAAENLRQFEYNPAGAATANIPTATETPSIGGFKAAESEVQTSNEINTGVKAVSNLDGRQGFTQTTTPLIPTVTANIPTSPKSEIQTATASTNREGTFVEKFGAALKQSAENTAEIFTGLVTDPLATVLGTNKTEASARVDTTSISNEIQTASTANARASTNREGTFIEQLEKFSPTEFLDNLLFSKAAASELHRETAETNAESRISTTSNISEAAAIPTSPINFGQPDFGNIELPEINIAEKITSEFESAKEVAVSTFSELGTSISSGFENIKNSASTALSELAMSFSTGFESLLTSATANIEMLAMNFSTGFETLKTGVATTFEEISTFASTGFETILTAASVTFSSLSSTISANVEAAHSSISTAFSSAAAEVQGVWSAVQGFFSGVFGSLGGIAAAAGSAIAAGINSGIGMIQSAWEALSGWLSAKISSLASMAASAAASIGIGGNAKGTSSWRGGFTTVNEHGGELIILPSGEKIYPHTTTQNVMGDVAHNYSGTSFFEGGWSEVNGTGSELMYLPSGTKIINHATTVSILKKQIREKLRDKSQRQSYTLKDTPYIQSASEIRSNSISDKSQRQSHILKDTPYIQSASEIQSNSISDKSQRQSYTLKDTPYIQPASEVHSNYISDKSQRQSYTLKDTPYIQSASEFQSDSRAIFEPAHNYSGTSYFEGGFSTVNEHGGELIQLPTGVTFYPRATAQNILQREIRTDRLGNIQNLNVPEYNRITSEDSLVVRRAKYQAQLNQYRSQQQARNIYGDSLESRVAVSQALTDMRRRALTEESAKNVIQEAGALNETSTILQQSLGQNTAQNANATYAGRTALANQSRNAVSSANSFDLQQGGQLDSQRNITRNSAHTNARRNFLEKGAEAVNNFFYRIFHPRKAKAQISQATSEKAGASNVYAPSQIESWDARTANIIGTLSARRNGIERATRREVKPRKAKAQREIQPPKIAVSAINGQAAPTVQSFSRERTSRADEIRSRVERDLQALHNVNGKPMPEIGARLQDLPSEVSETVTAINKTALFGRVQSATTLTQAGSFDSLTRLGDSTTFASAATADNRKSFLEKSAESVNNFFYRLFHPRKYAAQKNGYRTDRLGNIIGLNGLPDNIISSSDSVAVRRAKREAQRKEFLRKPKISEDMSRADSEAARSNNSRFSLKSAISRFTSNRRRGNWSSLLIALGDMIFNSSSGASTGDTALNPIKNTSFVSTKPAGNIFSNIVNIWRQSKNRRAGLNFDNIWEPFKTVNGISSNSNNLRDSGAFAIGDLPAIGGFGAMNPFETGSLPALPFNFADMARQFTTDNSSSTSSSTTNSRNSSANFNFGDVNINNGADFEEFLARLKNLFVQSADNYGGG